jgi:hypothetical protein
MKPGNELAIVSENQLGKSGSPEYCFAGDAHIIQRYYLLKQVMDLDVLNMLGLDRTQNVAPAAPPIKVDADQMWNSN